MHIVRESVMKIGSETMRLTYRQKTVQQNMDTQMLRLAPSRKSQSSEKCAGAHDQCLYQIYINRIEVKEDVVKHRRIKGTPTAKKGRKTISPGDMGHTVQCSGQY